MFADDFVAQCLDKAWISKSNLCPNLPSQDKVLTDIVLLFDKAQTNPVLVQTFDRDWTMI